MAQELEDTPKPNHNIEPTGFRRKRMAKQIALIIITSIGYMCIGMSLTWPNVFAFHTMKDNTTIFNTTVYLEDWQLDMLASVLFIGSMTGLLFTGWLAAYIGRRRTLIVSGLPSIIGTMMVALAPNVYILIIGRFIDGITYGMLGVSIRIYVVEISDVVTRGAAVIIVNLMMQIGSLMVLTAGVFITWYYVAIISCIIMAIYCILMIPIFLPESPAYLAIKNRDSEALSVLLSLRGPYADIQEELKQLKRINQVDSTKTKSGFKGLFKTQIIKRLTILFGLMTVCNFSGVQVLKSNTVRMLEDSGFELSKIVSTILITTVLFGGNFIMMLLVDKIGRRYCLILSFTIVAIAYYAIGIQNFVKKNVTVPEVFIETVSLEGSNTTVSYEGNISSNAIDAWNWVPVLCFMLAAFGQSLGTGPIPFILAPEYFPTNIRSQATSLCSVINGMLSVSTLQLFSPMQKLLTNGGLYFAYAAVASIGVPFTIFLIDETSRRSVG